LALGWSRSIFGKQHVRRSQKHEAGDRKSLSGESQFSFFEKEG